MSLGGSSSFSLISRMRQAMRVSASYKLGR